MADAAVAEFRRAGWQVDAELFRRSLRFHGCAGWGGSIGTADRNIRGIGGLGGVVVVSACFRIIAFVHTCTLQHWGQINPATMKTPKRLAQHAVANEFIDRAYIQLTADLNLDVSGAGPQLNLGVEIQAASIFC